jgi:hypothetical protein
MATPFDAAPRAAAMSATDLPPIRTTLDDDRDFPGTRFVNAVTSKIEDLARQCSPCAACADGTARRKAAADGRESVELDAPHENDGSSPRDGGGSAPWTDTYAEFRESTVKARGEDVVASQLDEINERLAADLSAIEDGTCDEKYASPVVVREVAGSGN